MKIVLFIFFALTSLSLSAQSDPQKIIDEFFGLYETKGVDRSMDFIFGTNKWMDKSRDQIEEVKLKLNSAVKLMGDYYGYNLITKKTVGDYYHLYTYMVRYDRQPIRFTIIFYKPGNQWKLMNFSFDDHLSEEIQEAAKLSKLKENIE
jgi:hypothetical protein